MARSENLTEEKINWIFQRLDELKSDQRSNHAEVKRRLEHLDAKLFRLHAKVMGEAAWEV